MDKISFEAVLQIITNHRVQGWINEKQEEELKYDIEREYAEEHK